MSKWTQVAAVALAAVVVLVPALAQLGPQTIAVLPVGEELDAAGLEAVEGEHWEMYLLGLTGVVYFTELSDVFMVPPAVTAAMVWAWGTLVD